MKFVLQFDTFIVARWDATLHLSMHWKDIVEHTNFHMFTF